MAWYAEFFADAGMGWDGWLLTSAVLVGFWALALLGLAALFGVSSDERPARQRIPVEVRDRTRGVEPTATRSARRAGRR